MVKRKVLVFVPARMGSNRFPGKCMHKIGNFPLVCWSYVQARMSGYATMVITPDQEIHEELIGNRRIPCMLTSDAPRNGTERCAEAVCSDLFSLFGDADIVIDVQGDMVRFDPSIIKQMVDVLASGCAEYVSAFTKLPNGASSSPNRVKCGVKSNGNGLIIDSFSRTVIPDRENYLHIGIYGYTKRALYRYCEWKKTENERVTKLEQMRIIDNGHTIAGVVSDSAPITIDCPEDVCWAEREVQHLEWHS